MHTDDLLPWLKNLIIVGREEDDEGNDSEDDESDDAGDNGEEGEGESSNNDDSDDGDDDENDPVKLRAALEAKNKALREERKLRRKAEREARRKGKQATTEKKTEEDVEAAEKVKNAEARAEKLAKGFKDKAVEDAVKLEARKQGFIDETDALLPSILREVDADQDDEDPTDVEVDLDSVKDAIAELASKKPHLVGKGTPGEPSGGKFRKRGKKDDEADGKVLESHYPSLR